jgi:hypothetical protein
MKRIHENLPAIEFDRPSNIVETVVTLRSGLLPTEDFRGPTVEEVFIAGTQPNEFDTSQQFDDERRNRVALSLARPTTASPSSILESLRNRTVTQDEPEDTEEEQEPDQDPVSSGENPFFSDSEPESPQEAPQANPFFLSTPVEDDDASPEEPESNPMLD